MEIESALLKKPPRGEKLLHYNLLQRRLSQLKPKFRQLKYRLRHEDLSVDEFVTALNNYFNSYRIYVEQELPHGTAQLFYAAEVSLEETLSQAQKDWEKVHHQFYEVDLDEKKAALQVRVIANAVMQVFEGIKTYYDLDS
jgi:hypothetical protein